MSPTAVANATDVRDLLLTSLVPSQTNRRFQRNEDADRQMLESIKVRGVIQPIVARPKGDLYEIVCGHRRFGRKTIPAVVRELTDLEALELQNIENLHREDLDIFDRALAAQDLVEAYRTAGEKNAIAKACEKLQFKDRTFYNLISLTKLCEAAQSRVREGTLPMSLAYEVARETTLGQARVLQYIVDQEKYGRTPSVRQVKEFIQTELHHNLNAAPWKHDDATLLASAGACNACPKNSAVNGSDKKRPICVDPGCFERKMAAHIDQKVKEGYVQITSRSWNVPKGVCGFGSWKQTKTGECEYAEKAVFVDDENKGRTILVCRMNNLCKRHFGRQTGADRQTSSNPSIDRYKKDQLRQARKSQLAHVVFQAQARELMNSARKLDQADLRAIARKFYDRLQHEFKKPICEMMGWKPVKGRYGNIDYKKPGFAAIDRMKPAELSGFLVLISIVNEDTPGNYFYGDPSNRQMAGFAKRHKVDLAKIEKIAGADLKKKWKEADDRKKRAAAKLKAKTGKQKAVKKAAA